MDRVDRYIIQELEKITPHTRECVRCNESFSITEEDLSFYKKLAVPAPTFCFTCRLKRRLLYRNERKLYKSTCHATGKDILSIFSPDKPRVVYNHEYWLSDEWDPLEFGMDYDPSRSFFEQWDELLKRTPVPNLMVLDNTNCEYTNHSARCESCYFTSVSTEDRFCMYGKALWSCERCTDCLDLHYCEDCYECVGGQRNVACVYAYFSADCYRAYFSENLKNCKNVIFCTHLSNKEYCIRNKEVTKEEFEEFIATLDWESARKEFAELRGKQIQKYYRGKNNEDCTGDGITQSKNCHYCFSTETSEECKYGIYLTDAKNCYDSYATKDAELLYEFAGGQGTYNSQFTIIGNFNKNISYTYFCSYSEDLFGCVSVKRKKYCILNKQYTKEEYFALVEKIKGDMLQRGEYGEFFPEYTALFAYNESPIQEYFPLTKEEAEQQGYVWKEQEEQHYGGTTYTPHEDISYYKNDEAMKLLLGGILTCNVTGKPYKITKQELGVYLQHGIPIPRKCPDQRHAERMLAMGEVKLWERTCMCTDGTHPEHSGASCSTSFQTSYAPTRLEQVYCEECFQKVIY